MRMFSEQARRARDRGWAWVLAAVAVAALVLPWAARASSCQADLNTSTIDPQILRDNQADASNQSVGESAAGNAARIWGPSRAPRSRNTGLAASRECVSIVSMLPQASSGRWSS